MKEIWKTIPNCIGKYEVSNLGRVRSLDCTVPMSDGRTYKLKGRILKPGKYKGIRSNTEYFRVDIRREVGKPHKHESVHRLVATAFIPNRKSKSQVNHKDGNGLNNNVYNLEWVTAQEQMQHAVNTGLKKSIRIFEHDGIKDTLQGWSTRSGLSAHCIQGRLNRGWEFSDAISKPKGYKLKSSRKTYCPRGHTLTVYENPYRTKCLECGRLWTRRWRAKRKQYL